MKSISGGRNFLSNSVHLKFWKEEEPHLPLTPTLPGHALGGGGGREGRRALPLDVSLWLHLEGEGEANGMALGSEK